MKGRQAGQAFILVLILLAIGATLVVPALQLTYTTLQSSRIVGRQNKGLVACEAAQELVMWKLYHSTLVDELPYNGDSVNFTVDVCGTPAHVTVVMRAVELEGGVTLATEHTIMPTKTVDTGYNPPDRVPNKDYSGPFTYTIAIKQVSSNNTAGLDRIYDIISTSFKAGNVYLGPSEISDDGINWTTIASPLEEKVGDNQRLRWPATGNFASPFRDFQPGQTKYLRFQIQKAFDQNDMAVCNYVMVLVGDVLTLSDPQAPILVGPNYPEDPEYEDGGVFSVTKACYPTVIPPLEPTYVTYTITVANMQGSTQGVFRIEDYLPPGFTYIGPTTTSMTNPVNQGPHTPELVNRNGVERYLLVWDSVQLTASGYQMPAGENRTLTFIARAEQGISGNYYNEVLVLPRNYPDPSAFSISDPPLEATYGQAYSWNSGVVIVPAYDSKAESEGVEVDANMALEPGRVRIISWSVR